MAGESVEIRVEVDGSALLRGSGFAAPMNVFVNWGDGTGDEPVTLGNFDVPHTYAAPGTFDVIFATADLLFGGTVTVTWSTENPFGWQWLSLVDNRPSEGSKPQGTTAPAVNTIDHAEVVKPLLDAALAPWEAFDYGEVPGTKGASGEVNEGDEPRMYALFTVERRFVDVQRSVALPSRSGWRVTVRSVGRTPMEVRRQQAQATAALDGIRLSVDGHVSTPLQLESSQAPEPDDGAYSGLDIYTYAF